MKPSAKQIAYCAVLTALSVLLLLLVTVVPVGNLWIMLITSFPVCAALMLFGYGWAAGVFALTAAIGFLLFPVTAVIGYTAFFGWYPIAKSLAERVHGRYVPLLIKLGLYSAAFFVVYWIFAGTLITQGKEFLPWYAVYGIGAVVLLVYDWAYSLLIRFYLDKIARFIQ